MRHRRNIVYLIFVLVAALVLGIIIFWQYQKKQWTNFNLDNPKLSFIYHRALKIEPQTKNDDETKTLFRATEGRLALPFITTLRQETGLRIIVSLGKQELIDALSGNLDKSFPARYQDYRKESEIKFDQFGKKTAEIYFTYEGPTGERIKQRFMIVVRDDDSAFYFSAQAKESDFDYLNKKYFDKMLRSIKFD